MLVRASPPAESMCCFLEQDTISAQCLVLAQPRMTCPDTTEHLLTGTHHIFTRGLSNLSSVNNIAHLNLIVKVTIL